MKLKILVCSVFSAALLIPIGCETPQSVIDLGSKTAVSQGIIAKRHLDTLSAYRKSLVEFKSDIKMMHEYLIRQHQISKSNAEEAWKNSIQLRMNEILAGFDEEAIKLLGETFEQKLEEIYWPPIVRKREEYKTKESIAKQKLVASPGDPVFMKQYREYGILSEYIPRIGYEKEGQIRKNAFAAYSDIRDSLKAKVASIISSNIKIQVSQNTDLKNQINTIETNIDRNIEEIDREIGWIEIALDNEAMAIDQINAYLKRPKEWELVLQGISTEIKNILGSYTSSIKESVLDEVGVPITQFFSEIESFDMDKLVDNEITGLEEKIDSLISNFQNKTIKQVTDKLETKKDTTL